MKLKKLTIKNIASIEDAEIDFSSTPLADEHLFLITGETGSGKSTIIDCICLALYGATPRLGQSRDNGVLYVSHKKDQKNVVARTKDARQLLRRGAGAGSITLTFDDEDNVSYIATWSVHRAHDKADGKLQDIERTLRTEKDDSYNEIRSSEIDKKIKEIIGLDVNQFFSTVMLAQGKFSEFLTSDEKEKSKLLERMTGTEIYTQIGAKIFAVSKEKENERNQLKEILKDIVLLNNEQKEKLNNELQELNDEHTQVTAKHTGAKEMAKWLDDKSKNEALLNDRLDKLRQHQAKTQEETFRLQSQLVQEWDMTAEARHQLKDLQEAQNKAEELQKEQPAMQQEFDRLSAALRALVSDIEDKKRQLAEIQKGLIQEESNSGMYSKIDVIQSHMEDRKTETQNIVEFNKALHTEEALLPKAEANVKAARETSERMNAELEQLQKQYDGFKISEINRHKDDLNKAQNALDSFKTRLEAVASSQKELDDIVQLIQEENKKLEIAQATLADKLALTEAAKQAVERQKDLEALVSQAHKSLHKGDTCPVCGNIIEQLLEVYDQSELEALQDKLRKAEKELEETQLNIMTSEKLIKTQKANLQDKKRDLQDKMGERNKQWSVCHQRLTALGKNVIEMFNQAQCDATHAEIEHEIERYNVIIGQAQEINTQIIAKRKQASEAVEQYSQATIALNKVKSSITAQRQTITECKKRLAKAIEDLNSLFVFDDWQQREAADSEFMAKLARQASDYQSKVNEEGHLKHAIELRQNSLPVMNAAKEKCKGVTDKGLTTTTIPNDIEKQWHLLESKNNQWNTQLENEQNRTRESKSWLDSYIQQNPAVSIQRLDELNTFQQVQIEAIKREQQATKNEVNTLEGEVKSYREQQDQILSTKPAFDEEDKEKLNAIIADCGAKLEHLNNEITTRKVTLNTDKQNRQTAGEREAQLEQAQKAYAEWKAFCDQLGDASGNTFRNIAQSFILNELLAKANNYLKHFNNRYRLESKTGTLIILVRDLMQGDLTSTLTLSGGETFMVSLALALALASMTGKIFSVDTIFIDEGFGSLSPTYLKTVMETLNQLYDLGGRRVGIISHVESLIECVTTRIQVERDSNNNTVSRIKVVG